MVDREKSKQSCSSGYLSRRLKEEDRISQLPDPLICHILSHLPTKDSVKTSVLSTRWRTLWLWLPILELDSTKLPDLSAFMSLGDRFFDSNRVSYIRKLKLTITHTSFVDGVDDNGSVFTSWIDAAVKRKVQRLHVHFPCLDVMMPLSLSTCETLVSLKLHMVALPYTESVSLPCLKTMRLTSVWFPDEATFERLVSSCLVLEELEIEGEISSKMDVFRVFSKSLKKLTTRMYFSLRRSGSGIVIDAPRLSFFSIYDYLSEKVLITNMDSNVTLDIHLGYGLLFNEREALSERNRLRSFLPKISKVRDMIIHRDTFKLLFKCSKLEPLPQFGYMSRLHVAFYYSLWKWLPTLLESFPNLKSLTMVCYDDNGIMHFEEMNHISFSHAPRCLLSSLEFVDFIVRTSEHVAEIKLVRYFLENSAILKKLTLHLDSNSTTEDEISKKILEIPRASIKCEVVIVKK